MYPDAAATPPTARDRWQHVADELLQAVGRHASASGALISLPGPVSASGKWSDGLEGFARTFLLAAFRTRGSGGEDPWAILERYARGLVAGTDPASPERWPTIAERRQAVVEAASIAIALSETRPWLWDRLDGAAQDRVVAWFSGVVGTGGYTNNWIWFQNVIEAFLASVGGPWRQDDLDRNAEIQESLYIGDGWYSDGTGPDGVRRSFDYYAGWAWHVYPFLHARIRGVDLEPLHRDRLRAFLEQARDLIGSHGDPLFQGRSLTYRFAMFAPFWVGAAADATPLERGATRALADSVLDRFLASGSVDERGLLSIGWHREFPLIRQVYTGSSSPYWASKGMLGLLLPPEHPEWSTAAPPPDRAAVSVRALRAPGWLVVRSERDGVVRVLNHGSDGFRGPTGLPRADNPFYQRVGYSTSTSPALSRTGVARPLESHVALLDAGGHPSHRDAIETIHVAGRVAVSRSRVHWLDRGTDAASADVAGWASLRRGPCVTVASVVNGVHELRLAWWTPSPEIAAPSAAADADSVWPADPGPWTFRIGGWPLPVEAGEWTGADGHATRPDGLTTTVRGVRRLTDTGLTHRTDRDAFAPGTVTPWAADPAPVASGDVVAALIALGTVGAGLDLTIEPAVEVRSDAVVVRWPDGAVDVVPTGGEVTA
ncbi:DUF2264 domain-containing protein [Microbacterium sp. BE35]|uniref:DUF2264 domain-containing protein n=1 Tax=Microbacterium sp. BE35 TaxID=2817773 RepID=UPI00286ADE59|nr:DUF2264 domain-containing protein [Microbacterium sp. BE35]